MWAHHHCFGSRRLRSAVVVVVVDNNGMMMLGLGVGGDLVERVRKWVLEMWRR